MQMYKSIVGFSVVVCSTLLAISPSKAADFLMIPDSQSDRVLLFDDSDGSLVNDNFIDGAGLFTTPLNAIQVNEEIWVSDQVADSIFRFDLNGNYKSAITGGLDNIRGMEFVDNKIYVSNSGTDNNAPGEAVVTFDTSGNNLGSFATGDPYDVLSYNGELLVNDINRDADGGEDIDRYSLDGNFVSTFHDSDGETGIDFPQQMAVRSNGNLIVGGFSAPGGIYEYDENGNQVGFFDGNNGVAFRGIRGVYELANGNVLWTAGDGVVSTNLETGEFTDIFTVNTPDLLPEADYRPSARYIEKVAISDKPAKVPEPGTILGSLLLGVFGAVGKLKGIENREFLVGIPVMET